MRSLIIFLGIFFAQFAAAQNVTGVHHQAVPAGTGAGETGEIRSYELTVNGEEFFAWKAADSMAASTVYEMPNAFPAAANRFFTCTTAGVCTWQVPSGVLPDDIFAETFTATPRGTDPGLTGRFCGLELAANGSNFFCWKAADSMASDNVYQMPNAFPTTSTMFMTCATDGTCSWLTPIQFNNISVFNSITFPHTTFSEIRSALPDGFDTLQIFIGGGGGTGPGRGGSINLYGNEHASQPGEVVIEAGTGKDTIFRAGGTEAGRIDDSRNTIIGGSTIAAPTSAINTLVIGGSTAPSADPAATVGAIWTDGTLGIAYRTGIASEGAGQANSVHNRFVEQYGGGASYTFTNASALINFGGNDAQVTIPSTGTWMLTASIYVRMEASTTFPLSRVITVRFRRTNNTPADLLSSGGTACRLVRDTGVISTGSGERRGLENFGFSCIYTTTNSNDIIAMYGKLNTLPTTGSLSAVSVVSYLQAIRLY